jgi:hypothetical protein
MSYSSHAASNLLFGISKALMVIGGGLILAGMFRRSQNIEIEESYVSYEEPKPRVIEQVIYEPPTPEEIALTEWRCKEQLLKSNTIKLMKFNSEYYYQAYKDVVIKDQVPVDEFYLLKHGPFGVTAEFIEEYLDRMEEEGVITAPDPNLYYKRHVLVDKYPKDWPFWRKVRYTLFG